jgi:hypothetical protein
MPIFIFGCMVELEIQVIQERKKLMASEMATNANHM